METSCLDLETSGVSISRKGAPVTQLFCGFVPNSDFMDHGHKALPLEAARMRLRRKMFLSYAREDKGPVERLHRRLLNAGYIPWMDSKDLLPGQYWEREIEEAIRGDLFLH